MLLGRILCFVSFPHPRRYIFLFSVNVFSLPWHRNNILKHASGQEILYPVQGGKALISKNSIVFISSLTLGVVWTKLFCVGPRHWLVLLAHSSVTARPQGPSMPDLCSGSYSGWRLPGLSVGGTEIRGKYAESSS